MKWSDTIPAKEEYALRRERWAGDQSSANVTLRVTTEAAAHALVKELVGERKRYPINEEGSPYPLYAQASSIVPAKNKFITDSDEEIIEYNEDLLVTIDYTPLGGSPESSTGSDHEKAIDPITGDEVAISESIEPISEFLIQDYKKFGWRILDRIPGSLSDIPSHYAWYIRGIRKEEAPGKLFKHVVFVREISGLSFVHPSVFGFGSKINKDPYISNYLNYTFRAGTLLFTPPIIRKETRIQPGEPTSRKLGMTLKFIHKDNGDGKDGAGDKFPAGWNWFWRAETEKFERMYHIDATGAPDYVGGEVDVYEEADMSNWIYPVGTP